MCSNRERRVRSPVDCPDGWIHILLRAIRLRSRQESQFICGRHIRMKFERQQIASSKLAPPQHPQQGRTDTQLRSFNGDPLGVSLVSSVAIHSLAILLVSTGLQSPALRPENYFPVRLIEIQPPAAEVAPPAPPAFEKEQPALIPTFR